MPPDRQRKFELIPTTLAVGNGNKPPMTSKAAKKAYAKTKQGPRVSRAEQRRLDQEILEKHRKEYEKEKAAKKAKAARDKKAEKAEEAKRERRKQGLPEPSRFVRASQPSISRFVRGEAGKRKWVDADEESEGIVADDEVQRSTKRLALVVEEVTQVKDSIGDESLAAGGPRDSGQDSGSIGNDNINNDEAESEDDFGEFPILSQMDFLEKIVEPSAMSSGQKVGLHIGGDEDECQVPDLKSDIILESPSQELPTRAAFIPGDEVVDCTQLMSDMASAQLLSEEAEAVAKSDGFEPPGSAQNQAPSVSIDTAMQPPPKPSSLSLSTIDNHSFRRPPKSRPQRPTGRALFQSPYPYPNHGQLPPDIRPSSTQAFLEDNIDSIMPSPSQEMQEILDHVDLDDLPSNTQIARELSPPKPTTRPLRLKFSKEQELNDFFCTQDFILSSQDLEEISPVKTRPTAASKRKSSLESTAEVPPRRSLRNSIDATKPRVCSTRQGDFKKRQPILDPLLDEFPSTQDLILTPQDLLEIVTPCRAPTFISPTLKTRNNLDAEIGRLLAQRPGPVPPGPLSKTSPQRFDLPRVGKPVQPQQRAPRKPTARRQNVKTTTEATEQVPKPSSENPTSPRVNSLPTKPKAIEKQTCQVSSSTKSQTKTRSQPKPRFFEEKENDLYEAALHESKIMAEQYNNNNNNNKNNNKHDTFAVPPKRPTSRCGPLNENTNNKENPNAGVLGSSEGKDRGISKGSSRRILQRVQSAVTDYGDDEFEGLSMEELFNLC